MKRIIAKKWFYLFFVPLVLFFLGVALSAYHILTHQTHFTVMPYMHKQNAELQIPQSALIDGEVVKGEFTAVDNNLGSIALAIKNQRKENLRDNYRLYFRFKEKGAKDWYSENTYAGGQFHELDRFPFGFTLIPDSKGKTYQFEVYTRGTNEDNAPHIDPKQKIVSHYQLNKSDLKKPVFALQYLQGKTSYVFTNLGGIFTIFVYFLPLYAYIYLIIEKKTTRVPAFISSILLFNFIRSIVLVHMARIVNGCLDFLVKMKILESYKKVKSIPFINFALFINILCEIFFIQGTNNILLLIIFMLWIITFFLYPLQRQTNFLLAFFFLVLCFISFIFHFEIFAQKTAIWAYIFLVAGVIQILYESKKNKIHL